MTQLLKALKGSVFAVCKYIVAKKHIMLKLLPCYKISLI